MGDTVTIAKYPDTIAAELARAHLESRGIRAFVVESAGFNPILNTTLGTSLEVDEADAARARAILDKFDSRPAEDEAESEAEEAPDDKVVRCPQCELEYCFFERPRPGRGTALAPLVSVVAFVGKAFFPERWHCHKCEYVWDDPHEGPKQITKLPPGYPRPVFRLFRGHGGMGLFLGLVGGGLCAIFFRGGIGLFALIAGGAGGVFIGRSLGGDVCSEPSCRTALPVGASECPGCKGTVAGRINAAHEHYSAAAEERRAVAKLARKFEAKAEKKRKKRKAQGQEIGRE